MNKWILVLVACFTLNANALEGKYVKGALGFTLNGTGEQTSGNGEGSGTGLEKDAPLPLILAFGFNLNDTFIGEGEFAYRKNDYVGNTPGDAKATSVMFNIVHKYNALEGFDLVHGAGVGLAQYKSGNEESVTLAYQFFSGIEKVVAPNIVIGTEWRYTSNLFNFELGGNKYRYDNAAWLVTGRFLF